MASSSSHLQIFALAALTALGGAAGCSSRYYYPTTDAGPLAHSGKYDPYLGRRMANRMVNYTLLHDPALNSLPLDIRGGEDQDQLKDTLLVKREAHMIYYSNIYCIRLIMFDQKRRKYTLKP